MFKKQYQDIQALVGYKSFQEVAEMYLDSLTAVKKVTKRTYQDLIDKINLELGDKKVKLY